MSGCSPQQGHSGSWHGHHTHGQLLRGMHAAAIARTPDRQLTSVRKNEPTSSTMSTAYTAGGSSSSDCAVVRVGLGCGRPATASLSRMDLLVSRNLCRKTTCDAGAHRHGMRDSIIQRTRQLLAHHQPLWQPDRHVAVSTGRIVVGARRTQPNGVPSR